MKTYEQITDLLEDLHVGSKSIHPDFHIFKFNETSNITEAALNPHFKTFFTIDFYADNQSERQIGSTKVENLNNAIGFNSPLQLFSVQPFEGNLGTEGYSLVFGSAFFQPKKHQYEIQHEFPFFKLNSSPFYKLIPTDLPRIKNLFDTIYEEFHKNDTHNVELVRSYLIVLLLQIKRVVGHANGMVPLKRYQEITANFEALILKETFKYKTIAAYAEQLNITPIYLSECVKKTTGITSKKVLSSYMTLRAKALLQQTTSSVAEIAYDMGFEEPTNFIKFFKNNEGITPAVFRKRP
ncbi:helix-turn-helix domain-containing protein [Algibacter miyuki]|uniref:Helix-turn-helix domain-containing protein n=1 Tax=Algibacter miyuki TaxID=1306933 RepID=A0ABV5H017_9FLAO|nr:helix-turn-helix transcriptional regulator [Algibacter miyuki]MDN3667506.1 helix-turn-helix domain-containing protein [Algibacter miyuki]